MKLTKVQTGKALEALGIGLGIITLVVLFGKHPVFVALLVIEAGMYFVGRYIKEEK